MLSNQSVNHFIDTFFTKAVVSVVVVGWVEAIAETHHFHAPFIEWVSLRSTHPTRVTIPAIIVVCPLLFMWDKVQPGWLIAR